MQRKEGGIIDLIDLTKQQNRQGHIEAIMAKDQVVVDQILAGKRARTDSEP